MSSYLVWDGSGGYLGHYGEKLKNEIEADRHAVGYTIIPRHHAKLATRMLEALEEFQWVRYSDPDWGVQTFCPECRQDKCDGHYKDCKLAALLSEARAQGGSDE